MWQLERCSGVVVDQKKYDYGEVEVGMKWRGCVREGSEGVRYGAEWRGW